jgi:ATP-dependent Lhr-like helicase
MNTPDDSIKRLLPRTWFPFFSRFGKPLEVQRQCVPKVLQGRNLVVCSPTASGKTEALLAPLAEKLLFERWEGLSILWISPTRALVNDLSARFTHPLSSLNISFARKTGDHPEFIPTRPVSLLITTPESFDSLLSRHPKIFETLKAVVLDDIHLLDGTYRGDQIRILLQRLLRILRKEVNTYLLSATMENPSSLGKRYMQHFDCINVESTKRIEFTLLSADGPFIDELIGECKRRSIQKVLVFVNSRAEAEQMVRRFQRPPFLHNTFAHHGSLSKKEREDIENFINTSSSGICVATTTLELGIDIGDIDAVVLYGPPHDVRSLLQRIGRGNRRRQDFALAYGIYKDAWEQVLFQALFHEAQSGRLEPEVYGPHLSVAVQQTLSYLYQRRRIGTTLKALKDILKPIIPEQQVRALLDQLSEKEYVGSTGKDIYHPSDRLLRIARRGHIHSNIDRGLAEYRVLNSESGKPMGSIQLLTPVFTLGGRSWEVVRTEKETVWVKPASRGLLLSGRTFRGKNIFWDYRLGLRVKERLLAKLATHEYPHRKINSVHYLFHFSGPLYGLLWQEALRKGKIEANDFEGTFLTIDGGAGPLEFIPEKGELLQAVIDNVKYLKRMLSLGAYFYLLPKDLQLQAVGQALKLDGFYNHLSKISFKEISGDDFASLMEILEISEDPIES